MTPEELSKLSPEDRAAISMIESPGGAGRGGSISRPNFWERTAVRAGDLGKKLSPGIGEGIYDLMPHSGVEAITDALTMALPEGKVIGRGLERMGLRGAERVGAAIGARGTGPGLARAAATGLGAAGAAKAEGSDMLPAFAQGVGAYGLASLPAKAVDLLNRWHMGSRLLTQDPKRVGAIINDLIPEFPNLRTAEEFRNAFVSKGAQQAASDEFVEGFRRVNAMPNMFGKRLHVPQFAGAVSDLIGKGVPQDLTVRQIADLWPKAMAVSGYGVSGQSLAGFSGARARVSHEQLVDEVAKEIEKFNPDAVPVFTQVLKRYSRARRMADVMATPGVLKNGELNMPKLQSLYSSKKPVMRLEGGREPAFEPEEVRRFWQQVFRGGKMGREDIPPMAPGFRLGLHGRGRPGLYAHLPHPGKYAGDPRSALAAILQNIGRGGAATGLNYELRGEEPAVAAH